MEGNIPFQQNLANVDLAIILLEASSNRLVDLSPLVERVKAALSKVRPGELVRVSAP